MKIEDVMERLIFYLYDAITEMLILTEEERFEEAATLRDEIDWKIIKTANYLIKKELTTLSIEDLLDNLMDVKWGFVKEITGLLEIPEEHHII
jgi:protein-arginine kinase activator protein McsA